MKTKPGIVPRGSYSLLIVEIPRLRGRELEEAIRHHLSGIYPGNIEKSRVAIRKNGRNKWSYLVFVFAEEPAGPLPVSTLLVQRHFAGKNARAVYAESEWVEFIQIERGAVLRSAVKNRALVSLPDGAAAFFGSQDRNPAEPITVFCREADRPLFQSPEHRASFALRSLEKTAGKADIPGISLFRHLSPGLKRRRIFLTFLSLVPLLGGVCFLNQYRASVQEKTARARREQELRDRVLEAERREQRQLAELRSAYEAAAADKRADPYETAGLIALCLEPDPIRRAPKARIISATIKEGFFQFEAYAPDALEVLRAFENNRRIRAPSLGQIHPSDGGERFTLSGTALPEVERVDPALPADVQRAALERLAAEIQAPGGKTGLTPAAFGGEVRSLLAKWACGTGSYQYLNSGKEMEFSVRAPSGGFFGFLRDASDSGWNFTLVRINNLAPRNLVDVIFRIKIPVAETADAAGDAAGDGAAYVTAAAHGQHEAPLPVAVISRPYTPAYAPAVESPTASPVPEPSVSPPVSPAEIPRLEYLGTISDRNERQFIYVKNTKTGELISLEMNGGATGYRILESGAVEARINGNVCIIGGK
jgi:hypothetical protein